MLLKFKAPAPDAPGYLLRMKKALAFQQQLSDNPTPETIDALVDFLVDYVTEPADKEEARDALFMASQAQFNDLLTAVVADSAEGTNPT